MTVTKEAGHHQSACSLSRLARASDIAWGRVAAAGRGVLPSRAWSSAASSTPGACPSASARGTDSSPPG